MSWIRVLALLVGCSTWNTPALSAQIGTLGNSAPLSPSEMLASAEQAMDDAARVAADEPELAEDLYEQAAARYEALITAHGLRSAPLYRAQGNARLLSGDTGRAVLNFRRAQQLDPLDARTAASLEHARSRVRTSVAPDLGHRAMGAVLWWRGRIPRGAVFAGFALCFAAVWVLEIVRLVRRRGLSPALTLGAGVVSVACLGSLLLERYATRSVEHVVLVRRDVIARTGPSEDVYPPAFEEPMDAGVEAVAMEHRDGWVRLRLADGREMWVPGSAVERV